MAFIYGTLSMKKMNKVKRHFTVFTVKAIMFIFSDQKVKNFTRVLHSSEYQFFHLAEYIHCERVNILCIVALETFALYFSTLLKSFLQGIY